MEMLKFIKLENLGTVIYIHTYLLLGLLLDDSPWFVKKFGLTFSN